MPAFPGIVTPEPAMVRKTTSLRAPFLKRVAVDPERIEGREGYPFDLPIVRGEFEIVFETPVTIIVGENGTGKSTLLEAIAETAGFGTAGGSRDHRLADDATERHRNSAFEDFIEPMRRHRSRLLDDARSDPRLTDALRFAWLPKVGQGFFFRAETFHRLARYLDEAALSGLALHLPPEHLKMSHAEGFIDYFAMRFEQARRNRRPCLFIFDEPESALSPKRQLDFIRMLRDLTAEGLAQVIIASHSPLLMAYPGSRLFRLTRGGAEPCTLRETEHFQLLREFCVDPEGFVEAFLQG